MAGILAAGLQTPVGDLPALLVPAYVDTVIMVGAVMVFVAVFGTALGALVDNLAPQGLFPHTAAYQGLSWTISIGRSLPFLVLMAAIMPITRFVTGTNIGIGGAIVPMAVGGTAFFARIVENSLRSVPVACTRLALTSGGSNVQITRTLLYEALPSIIGGLTICTIAMIEYSAIAGAIGAGGIGYLAISFGYQRFDHTVMISTIVVLIATVVVVQLVGDALVRLTTKDTVSG